MSWIDRGRQKHGQFAHGTAGSPSATSKRQIKGRASYYNLPGNNMANGKPFDPDAMSAAMLNVLLGTTVRVTSLANPSKSIEVTVTDRGPYVPGRIIELTPNAFRILFGSTRSGTGAVVVQVPSAQ